jgi:hypothetical protein
MPAQNDINVNVKYTSDGMDAINRENALLDRQFNRLISRANEFGRGLSTLGDIFQNEFLTGLGQATSQMTRLIDAADAATVGFGKLGLAAQNALKIGGAGAGGVFLGAAIYDATIGKQQGTDAGTIISQTAQLFVSGFNPQVIIAQKRLEAFSIAADVAEKRLASGYNDIEALRALRAYPDKTYNLGQGAHPTPANSLALAYASRLQRGALGGMNPLAGTGMSGRGYTGTSYEDQLNRATQLAEVSANLITQRLAAAASLSSDLARMDTAYYANRLKMAEQYGLAAQRAEQDHQVSMRRLSQSHAERLSKLADSRDALGIEDEMKSYEIERGNAEEDYRIQQARRDQDYALQLRDLENAQRQQRQERIDAYNQQLLDQQAAARIQNQIIVNGMTDLVKSLLTVFTSAARGATEGAEKGGTTISKSVNQNMNFGSVSDPAQIKQVVYSAIIDAFAGHGTG